MDLITPRYSATEIQEQERVISCKRVITAGNQIMALLTVLDDSSLVIDKLCDRIVEEDTAVACFYFDFAARNEQSPVDVLGSLLRQLVYGLEGIPEVVVQCFRNEKKAIGGRGLQAVFPTGQVGQAAAKPSLAYGNSLEPGLARDYRLCKA